MTRTLNRAVMVTAVLALGIAASGALHGQTTPPALPPGPAHDLTVRVCSGCHAPEIAAQQRLNRQGWEEVIEMMASRGAVASDAELAQITEYLSTNFPATPSPPPPH